MFGFLFIQGDTRSFQSVIESSCSPAQQFSNSEMLYNLASLRGGVSNVVETSRIDSVTSRLGRQASRSQLNGNARRAPAHWRRIHSARADDNYTCRWRAGVTSLNVIAEHDADWLRAALTDRHCFSGC